MAKSRAGSYNLHLHYQSTNSRVIGLGSYHLASVHDFQMAVGSGNCNMNFSVGLCNTNTNCGGSNYTQIVANTATYSSNTAIAVNVSLGSGSAINLNAPQGSKRIRFGARIVDNATGYWFILFYNGNSSDTDTYIQIPAITVPERIWVLIAVIPFLPWLVRKILIKQQRSKGS